MTRTQEFIDKNRKILTSGPDFYNPDTSLMSIDDYHKAKCRMLVIFPTPHVVKTVSSTAAALNDFVITHCKDTFIDFAYLPENEDIKRYDDWNVPYAIGNITHLDPSHYDIVGFSISVLHEVVSGPSILSTFDRCDKPIPLFWSQRKDMPIGSVPLIYAGGITAACGESMFGKVNVNGKVEQGYMDFVYLGDCGHTHHITNRFIEALETGKCHRSQSDHDVPGYPHKDIENFEEVCTINTMQDFVDSLFDMQEIYQPQAYEVEYNKHNRIVKNIKINPKAQDFVKPYYPFDIQNDLGIARTIINASGDGTGTAQVQISEGCSCAGACSFCSEGNYCLPKGTLLKTDKGLTAIDEVKVGDQVVLNNSKFKVTDTVVVGEKPLTTITMFNNLQLKVANTHLLLTIENGKLLYKRAFQLNEGDFIAYERSESFGSYKDTNAYLIGAILGDGLFYPDKNLVKLYVRDVELAEFKINVPQLLVTSKREGGKIFDMSRQLKELSYQLQESGLTHETALTKRVPKRFFNGTKETVAELLRGLFDTDGTIKLDSKNRATVSFTTVSSQMSKDVVELLSMFGIRATIYKHHSKGHYKKDGSFIKASTSYDVTVFGNENVRRFKSIGFKLNRKQEKLMSSVEAAYEVDYVPTFEERLREFYRENPTFNKQVRKENDSLRKVVNGWSRMHWLSKRHFEKSMDVLSDDIKKDYVEASKYEFIQITSIETTDPEMMYDISVEDSHAYSLCGWVSHNTSGWTEKSHEEILKESWECKKYSSAYKFKPFSFNCVAVGTLVPTHKGLQYVENLKEDQDILSVVDWTTHKGIHSSIQPTVSVYMSQGPGLQLTLQHRQTVLTSEGLTEVKAEELEAGMWMPQRIGYYSPEKVDVTSTSYLLGLWYGDGYYSGNSTYVLVDQNDTELNAIVKTHEYCQRLVRTEGNLNVYLLSKEFTKYCKAICPYKDSFRLCDKLNTQQSLEYIRGLFDADGCGSGGFLKITQKESRVKLLKEIQVILMSVGIRTRMSLPTKVTLNGVEHTRRDVYVVGRESRDNFVNIIGASEVRKSQYVKTKATKWSDKDKCIPPIFGVWVYNELKKIDAHKGHNVSKFFNGLKGISVDRFLELFGSYDIEPVQLVKAGIRFAQVLAIEDAGECEVVDVMETTNGRWIANGYVTHNCNYLTDYKGMLAKWIQVYPKVTFINMRMEELGRDVDALKMMKLVGSNRISAPMEGMSPRIQNNLLNKCLSTEALNNFMEEIVHQHLTDIKVGGIFTGYEEDEDFQWQCDFVDRLRKKAAEEGGSFPYRLKCTPLVHYSLTAIEYLERKSARKSYNGEHWLTDEWYEKFREHNIHFKVNGFRYSTYLEQSFIDLGRSITDMIYRHFIKDHVKVYSLRSCATYEYIAELKSITDEEGFFGDRDPEHYISPCHRIHIDLMGSYIPRARRILRFKDDGKIYDNPEDIRCLKTFDGAKTKCYHNCIIKDPLKIYNDVIMDENGNLHGDYVNLNGCERCPTPKRRVERLKRPTPQTKDSDDIIATPRIPQVQKVRFVLKRKSEYDVLNPNNTAHTFMTKFLQLSDTLLHNYHSIVSHNMLWQSAPAFKDYVYGYQIVDTMWSKNSIKEIKELIPEVNKLLKSVQVVSAQDILRDEKLLITDYNTWIFESSLPKEQFDGAAHSYKGQIKVEAQVQGFALTETTDSTLMKPIYQQIGGKVYGAFTIPAKYNPIMYLMGYVSQSKKTSEDGVVTTTQFQCVSATRETKMPCRNCSSENAMISLITGKPLPFGKKCLSKVVLSQLLKAMK